MDKQILLEIGEKLKAARLACGMSLKEVSAETRISHSYLRAIEEADTSALKLNIYTIGYIKNYAKLVNVALDDLLEMLKEAKAVQLNPVASGQLITGKEFLPSKGIIAVSVLLLTLLYIFVEFVV